MAEKKKVSKPMKPFKQWVAIKDSGVRFKNAMVWDSKEFAADDMAYSEESGRIVQVLVTEVIRGK